MKAYCSTHGVHFPDEFNKTLPKNCAFWKDRGLNTLLVKYKKEIWDWMFSLDVDAIYSAGRHKLNISLTGEKVKKPKVFADIPEYAALTEPERRRFQRIATKAKEIGVL